MDIFLTEKIVKIWLIEPKIPPLSSKGILIGTALFFCSAHDDEIYDGNSFLYLNIGIS